ncbi:MAG: PilZ domain-containing protein [Kofleriaceae bacterium]
MIFARYLRSGRWVPIRIGALSLKGAALMAGALPRLHDHVDVALSFGDHRALVRGPVKKVSTIEEVAASGAATFSVSFELDDSSRRQLTALLTAARDARVTIKPPPPRQARRYPVEWEVSLGTLLGVVRAEALDVSRDGMFVKPIHTLTLDGNLDFSTVLDDGGGPVSGRARVVRQIEEAQARDLGLAPGYGLRVVEMAEADHARWLSFLHRIECRAEKRVLIGASPSRLVELQTGLAAAGYAVTGGTDPGSMVQLASAEIRPVDAVLIDSNWITPGMSASWIESLFMARNVPCLMIDGDARRARAAIDNLLTIA